MSRPFKEYRTELKARQEKRRQKEAAKRAEQQECDNIKIKYHNLTKQK